MQKCLFLTLLLCCVSFSTHDARAQEQQPPREPAKIEVGVQFSSLNTGEKVHPGLVALDLPTSDAGFGGRFGFNLNRHVAFEAEINFFPQERGQALNSGGRLVQAQFGTKIGKRFEKFGFFGKVRPGFLSYSKIETKVGEIDRGFEVFSIFEPQRRNFFSLDVGGVVEFYPSKRILARFDIGDTMVYVGEDPQTERFATPIPKLAHKFQFSSGIAFRFLNPGSPDDDVAYTPCCERKFEVGGQFSSLAFRQFFYFAPEQTSPLNLFVFDVDPQPGLGGRFTYNITPSIAAEVQADFYPKRQFFPDGTAGGRTFQVQAGAKIGKRFEKFGVFGKLRPGAMSFSETLIFEDLGPPPTFFPFDFRIDRTTYFSLDAGGVLEFYPSPRVVVRFDAGDTMIRYGGNELPFLVVFPITQPVPVPVAPRQFLHHFQFSSGVGFRF